jgi:hypothetical protein
MKILEIILLLFSLWGVSIILGQALVALKNNKIFTTLSLLTYIPILGIIPGAIILIGSIIFFIISGWLIIYNTIIKWWYKMKEIINLFQK